jgi:hypothetical protein
MLFDESTSALDPELVGEVLKTIGGTGERGPHRGRPDPAARTSRDDVGQRQRASPGWSARLTLRHAGCATVAMVTEHPRPDAYRLFSGPGAVLLRTRVRTRVSTPARVERNQIATHLHSRDPQRLAGRPDDARRGCRELRLCRSDAGITGAAPGCPVAERVPTLGAAAGPGRADVGSYGGIWRNIASRRRRTGNAEIWRFRRSSL